MVVNDQNIFQEQNSDSLDSTQQSLRNIAISMRVFGISAHEFMNRTDAKPLQARSLCMGPAPASTLSALPYGHRHRHGIGVGAMPTHTNFAQVLLNIRALVLPRVVKGVRIRKKLLQPGMRSRAAHLLRQGRSMRVLCFYLSFN
jgi:hypothetical protein